MLEFYSLSLLTIATFSLNVFNPLAFNGIIDMDGSMSTILLFTFHLYQLTLIMYH